MNHKRRKKILYYFFIGTLIISTNLFFTSCGENNKNKDGKIQYYIPEDEISKFDEETENPNENTEEFDILSDEEFIDDDEVVKVED